MTISPQNLNNANLDILMFFSVIYKILDYDEILQLVNIMLLIKRNTMTEEPSVVLGY